MALNIKDLEGITKTYITAMNDWKVFYNQSYLNMWNMWMGPSFEERVYRALEERDTKEVFRLLKH